METIHLEHPFHESLAHKVEPCVMALGFFDGVHLGHRRIIQKAKEIAMKEELKFAVLTFYPHPREVINQRANPVQYLSPFSVKKEIFANLGVERLYVVKFDLNFSVLSPADFVKKYILGLRCKHVVAGFDFTYGYKGEGNMDQLAKEGTANNFGVTMITKIEQQNQKISSTKIRQLVSSGHVNLIPQYLGDYYEIRGKVNAFSPTSKRDDSSILQIYVDKGYLLPKPGVYQIQVQSENQCYEGICKQRLPANNTIDIIEVQLFDCFKMTDEGNIKVKWMNHILDEQKIHMVVN